MSSIEDQYFQRMEKILDVRMPKIGESRLVQLDLPDPTSKAEAEQLLALVRSRKQQLLELTSEVAEAETRYLRPFFGNQWKATQCRAVLLTLAQINPALTNQEIALLRWIQDQDMMPQLHKVCDHCQASISASARFCTNCGHPASIAPEPQSITSSKAKTRSKSAETTPRKPTESLAHALNRRIRLKVTPHGSGASYDVDGEWSLISGMLELRGISNRKKVSSFSLNGVIDSQMGLVNLDLVSDDIYAPDYSITGTLDLEDGFLSLDITSADLDAPDYSIVGFIGLESGLIELDATTLDIEASDYHVSGTL